MWRWEGADGACAAATRLRDQAPITSAALQLACGAGTGRTWSKNGGTSPSDSAQVFAS